MKFFRLDLLTLLISLFILNSCKNQDTVGLGVNSTQVNGKLVDTSTLLINTVREDSIITSSATKNPLAFFTDPVFGTTESNLALSLSLPNAASYSLPSGTISIDSVRLVMPFADGFYGDSVASNYKLNVYQLTEKYDETKSYYNTKQWQYNSSSLLGSVTFKARTHDSIKIYNIISGAADTLIKVPAQLRVPISTSFIIQNFFNASNATLSSNTVFQTLIKGLYVTLDKNQTTGPGGAFMFAKGDTIAIYCKINNGTTIDTTQVKLPITGLAANITHTYSTTINAALNSTANTSNTFYLQGLAGLRAKISFPNLLVNLRNDLLKRDSDIVLNRAELVITPSAGSTIPYRPIPRITLYRLDIAHQRVAVPDASTSDPRAGGAAIFGGYYSSVLKDYHFILTAYMQDLLLKKAIDYGTYIAPVDTTNTTGVDIVATHEIAARTVAVGTDASSAYKIKLNIIYTKIARPQ